MFDELNYVYQNCQYFRDQNFALNSIYVLSFHKSELFIAMMWTFASYSEGGAYLV